MALVVTIEGDETRTRERDLANVIPPACLFEGEAAVKNFSWLWAAKEVVRHFGMRWVAQRAWYLTKRRSGWFALRQPAGSWDALPLPSLLKSNRYSEPSALKQHLLTHRHRFFNCSSELLASRFGVWDAEQNSLFGHVENSRSKFLVFGREVDFQTFPPAWHTNVFTGEIFATNRHWSRIRFGRNDVRSIWELSRFAFAFRLVRAYSRTKQDDFAETFWQLLEDWREKNPPLTGVNWTCGQEAALRILAWGFALFGLLESSSSTPKRVADLVQMMSISARRVALTLDYAATQQNNHAISEAVALWTVGLVLPELQGSNKWREIGRDQLVKCVRSLIRDDGSFSQDSTNYHRLTLDVLTWAIQLAKLHKQPFDEEIHSRVASAVNFLYQMQEPDNGRVPNVGQSDSSYLFPLTNCSAEDLRPTLQAASLATVDARLYAAGAWDEQAAWFGCRPDVASPPLQPQRENLSAMCGGHYTIRGKKSWVYIRTASKTSRPSHADVLHVDLWHRGRNVAVDAGTFSYGAGRDGNPLARAAYHNTVTVDGHDPMIRVGQFLWLPWRRVSVPRAGCSAQSQLEYWQAEHNGSARDVNRVRHRRGILRIGDESWLVLDRLEGVHIERYRLHWLFAECPFVWHSNESQLALEYDSAHVQVCVATDADCSATSLVRADSESPRGWQAIKYRYAVPALSLATVAIARDVWFWSVIGPDRALLTRRENSLFIRSEQWQLDASLAEESAATATSNASLLASVKLHGDEYDSLAMSK